MRERGPEVSRRYTFALAVAVTLTSACGESGGAEAGQGSATNSGGGGGSGSTNAGGAWNGSASHVDAGGSIANAGAGVGGGWGASDPEPNGDGMAPSAAGTNAGGASSRGLQVAGSGQGGSGQSGIGHAGSLHTGSGQAGSLHVRAEAKNTRLEAWQLETQGAPPLALGGIHGIWDTREKVFCNFVRAEDGKLRCMPEVPESYSESDAYADAQCKQALFWVYRQDGQVPPARPWARPISNRQGLGRCEPARYQALRPIASDSPMYRVAVDGACQRVEAAEGAPGDIPQLKLIAEAPDRWEEGTESNGARLSDRLHTVDVITADGARFVSRLVDDRWSMACTLRPGSDAGTVECRPNTVAIGRRLFADDQCTTDLQLVADTECQPAAFIQERDDRFALGARYSGSVFVDQPKSGCDLGATAEVAAANGERYFLKGEPLGADATEQVREANLGTGRVRTWGLVGENNLFVPIPTGMFSYASRRYFDSIANESCEPVWTSDGQVRCIPASIPILTLIYYVDSACTQASFSCGDDTACATRKAIFATQDARGRSVARAAYSTFTPLEKANLYSGAPGQSCQMVGSNVEGVWVPGAELALDQFPTLQERHPIPAIAQ